MWTFIKQELLSTGNAILFFSKNDMERNTSITFQDATEVAAKIAELIASWEEQDAFNELTQEVQE